MTFSCTGPSFVRSAQNAFSPTMVGGIVKGQQQPSLVLMTLRTTSSGGRRRQPLGSSGASTGSSGSVEEKVAALRATAAKAREDADRWSRDTDRWSRELGKTPSSSSSSSSSSKASAKSSSAAQPKKSRDEIIAMIRALHRRSGFKKQVQQWQALKASSCITKFGQADLATFPVSLAMLEQRTSLTPKTLGLLDLDEYEYATTTTTTTLNVTEGGTASPVASNASLAFTPENVDGATAVVAAVKGTTDIDGNASSSVSLQERVCRHEAAHLCCAYWCGQTAVRYAVRDQLAHVTFVCIAEPGVRGLSEKQVAGQAVTALAGVVAEALQWKNAAQGSGKNHLLMLDRVFHDSAEFIDAAKQQNLARWGALTAAMLLKNNSESYENVVQAVVRQADLVECIAILESE